MRISYVNGICVRHDAISNSVRNEIRVLSENGQHDVRLFAYACDFADIPYSLVESVGDIAMDPHFQSSDLIVFHFGVYYPLFDLTAVAPTGAKRLVVFHNITPKEVLPPSQWPTIERSCMQLPNAAWVDHVLCDSETNLLALQQASVSTPASVMPLPVHVTKGPASKTSFEDSILRILFLGRFVRSKGPQDLLNAMQAVMRDVPQGILVNVDLVGNMLFSDQELLTELRAAAAELERDYRGSLTVTFRGNVDDDAKHELLQRADMFVLPTYHEGFCVPIIEALASGCVVVAYENSNTPAISGGLASLTRTGDVASLAVAIRQAMELTASRHWRSEGYAEHLERAWLHACRFSPPLVAHRFLSFVESLVAA
jgi:glycosyltransferase involved in cell wall biosynthesis